MRPKIILFVFLFLLSFSTIAEEPQEPLAAETGGFANIAELIANAAGNVVANSFESKPDEAWAAVEEFPGVMEREVVVNAAFNNDVRRAAKVVDKKPELLKKPAVLDRVAEEVVKPENQEQDFPVLLNDNPDLKKTFLEEKHGIKMDDKSVEIKGYDGKKIVIIKQNDVYAATLSGDNYQDGELRITSHGEIEFNPLNEGQKIEIPKEDNVILDTQGKTVDYKGHAVKGRLEFAHGNSFISNLKPDQFLSDPFAPPKPVVEIDNVAITPGKGTYIYLLLEHEEKERGDYLDYIYLNKKERKIDFNSVNNFEVFYASFKPGNPYMEVNENDRLSFNVKNARFSVQNRDAEDLIPLVSYGQEEKGRIEIINGMNKYTWAGKLNYDGPDSVELKGSVPFTMAEFSLLEGREGDKIIFDGSNNFLVDTYRLTEGYLPKYFPDEQEAKYQLEGFNLVDNRAAYSHWRNKILMETGIEADSELIPLEKISSKLKNLPESLKVGLKKIKIVPEEDIEKYCGYTNAGGCAKGRSIVMTHLSFEHSPSHEIAHTKTFELEKEWFPDSEIFAKEYVSFALEMKRKYGEEFEQKLAGPEKIRMDNLRQNLKGKSGTLVREWEGVANSEGKVYGRGLAPPRVACNLGFCLNSDSWEDGSNGPRNGCVTAYGCNNYHEDISEYTEMIYSDPDSIQPLITPPGELGHDPQKYIPVYRKKLDLLYKYGYITTQDYDQITKKREDKEEVAKNE